MIPQALFVRLAVLAVTTLATTVVPVLVQDRPVLKWTWDKYGPVIETRVKDRLEDRLGPKDPVDIDINATGPMSPRVYNDGVDCKTPACFDPAATASNPVINPNDYCRPHWWTAGPVRWLASLPFRLFS